ncbi:hypothetical protein [Paludisphaera soli]|uniref:hypothetical protein n=1 Tax=Paludisphaera soli TaxID=2712865 RepID=UPI0013EC2434|nr:hypothetical protein [Paludisphaera soli]
MKRAGRFQIFAVITLAGLAAFATLGRSGPAVAQGEAPDDLAPHGWEYKFVPNYNEQEFNFFGKDGWELAEYVPPTPSNGAHIFIFKRPVFRQR